MTISLTPIVITYAFEDDIFLQHVIAVKGLAPRSKYVHMFRSNALEKPLAK
jgi:hypothetical protein